MNWAAIAAGFALLTFLSTLCVGAYVYGKLTQQTSDNSKRLDTQAGMLEGHAERIGIHDVKIGRLEQWKDGFNAGSRVAAREH